MSLSNQRALRILMDTSTRHTNVDRDAQRPNSTTAYEEARTYIPGGVNSPARAFEGVGGHPVFIREAKGAWLEDVDGNRYVDYLCSWGPMLFGHAAPNMIEAVDAQARRSPAYGTPTELETEVAKLLCALVPSVEKVRMTNSGTEATMSAVRLARGYTGREKIIKFEGHYHGHGDSFLVASGSGSMTQGRPDSDGIPAGTSEATLIARYNDLDHVRTLLQKHAGQIAAIMVEPIVGNMGCIPPTPGFLEGLRTLCDKNDLLLIFDEVMTGFRVAPGGAQERCGVLPDLTCLGKIMGGGLPVGAFGGRADVMDALSPMGPVYQSGTLSGSPLVMRVSHAVLRRIQEQGDAMYDALEQFGAALEAGLREPLKDMGIPHQINRVGAMGSLFFAEEPVSTLEAVRHIDTDTYASYFHAMLEEGVYLPPSPFESFFFSTAHGETEIDHTLTAHRKALKRLFDR